MADTSKYTISLSAPATLTATLGAGKINVNDYTLAMEEVENGVKLTLTRGSKTDTVFIPDYAEDEAARKSAESARVSAENTRIAAEKVRAAAESARVTAETSRTSAESTRASNETARVSAETNRASAEQSRVSAETARASAETSRASAETSRANAETARANAEQERASNESTRVANEADRVSAESARVSAESERATEFATFEAQIAAKADKAEVAKIFNALLKQDMNWAAVAELVRAGMGEAAFPVGSQFAVQHSEYGTLLFDVVGHNHHKKPGDPDAPTMTLLMHHCIYGCQIDASELLWANTGDSALAAGTYNFTLYKGSNGGQTYEDGTYQFTTTKPIPAGGGWTHNKVGNWYANAADYKPENITSGTVTTYDAAGTVLESGLAVTAGSDGTALGTASNAKADCVNTIGTFNSVMRRAYGSNNWAESAARQWLNSSAAANGWWQRQTIFDMVPNYANKAGSLAGLDPDFVDALGAVDIVTARNTIYEMGDTLGGSYTTRDKLFLPSMAEIGLGSNDSVAEGSVLPLYDGATQTDRIKYDQAAQTTARYWWLRSPLPWNAVRVRIVYPSGALNYSLATNDYRLAAACVIY